MLICKTNLHKKMDLYLNYSLIKSRFPLNLTYGRMDISNYRVALLLEKYKTILSSDFMKYVLEYDVSKLNFAS